jgi:hypothetical protein
VVRYVRAFGAFWYDFLIGDRIELFLGPLAALLLVWIAVRVGGGALDGLLLFLAILAVGGVSLALSVRPRC